MNLEKSRQSKKVMSSLKVNGETIHNNEEILTKEANFYRKLTLQKMLIQAVLQTICLTLMILQS